MPRHGAADIRRAALAQIGALLDRCGALREALAEHLDAPPETAARVADWLCPEDGAHLRHAVYTFGKEVPRALKSMRRKGIDASDLYNDARAVVGWMVVTAVSDDFSCEDAPAVEAWRKGISFRIPLRSREAVEILLAGWRRGRPEIHLKQGALGRGEDDITPENMRELGFDDPNRLETHRLVEEVWRIVYTRINKVTAAPTIIPQGEKDTLEERMEELEEEESRRLHILVDRNDLDQGFASPAAVEALHSTLPRIRLLFIDSGRAAGPDSERVFVLPEAKLTNAIRQCLLAVEECR